MQNPALGITESLKEIKECKLQAAHILAVVTNTHKHTQNTLYLFTC